MHIRSHTTYPMKKTSTTNTAFLSLPICAVTDASIGGWTRHFQAFGFPNAAYAQTQASPHPPTPEPYPCLFSDPRCGDGGGSTEYPRCCTSSPKSPAFPFQVFIRLKSLFLSPAWQRGEENKKKRKKTREDGFLITNSSLD